MNTLRNSFIALMFLMTLFVGVLHAEEQKPAQDPKKVDGKEVHEVITEKGAALEHTVTPPTAPVSGSAAIGIFNKYIFRGYELSNKSFVIQPTVSVSYKNFSATLWSNIDSSVHPTQSTIGDYSGYITNNRGQKKYNETDLTLSYTYILNKLSLTGGYIYYGTSYAHETEELFASATYDMIAHPTLAIYRDINAYAGTYFNLALSQSFPVYKEITLDLGASAGYEAGSGTFWKTFNTTTGNYDGKKYSALHDGMVKAGFTIPVAKNVNVQPVAQYWFPLSGKAKRVVNGSDYNPNGHLDETFVYGLNMTLTF